MESELWPGVYRAVYEEGNRRPRPAGVVYSDARVLEVYFWAAAHDRPTGWACDERHWPAGDRWRRLPSASTMSVRLRTLSVRLLMAAVLDRLRAAGGGYEPLARRLDSKPLPVGGYSKDADARRGQACDHTARGYKVFGAWGAAVVPDAWSLGPMSAADSEVAAADLVPRLRGAAYVLGDALHDSNPLHAACRACGCQLVAPRKRPGTGLGHRAHDPGRVRSVEMLEWPVRLGTTRSAFARGLYALRGDIERRYGNLTGFGGGLQPLPSWVRTPHRVALWVAAKFVINGLRQCRLKGLAA